jgi:hypothetical protein
MAISSQGTTFTFAGFQAHFTSISVEEPQAEIVDMTSGVGTAIDPLRVRRMVATGDIISPARVQVDYIRLSGTPAPMAISGLSGQLSIAHANISVTRQAILESATSEMAVGEFLRGSLNFVIDHQTP